MIRHITILTLDWQVPVTRTNMAAQHAPWGDMRTGQQVDLSGGKLDTMYLYDSDPMLENVAMAQRHGTQPETEQYLSQPLTLGSGTSTETLPEGTLMTFSFYRILEDDNGNRFAVSFPHLPGDDSIGTMVGNRYSLMVLPMAQTDADGNTTFPTFDPTAGFTVRQRPTFGPSHYSLPYAPLTSVDCFAAGTLIDTATGPRAVETLRAGDLIRTQDRGLQPLSWVRGTPVDAARLDVQPNLRPIRISAGALGQGTPRRDLIVSPQHRVLVRSVIVQRMFGHSEVLVAAKHLLGLPGISVLNPPQGVEYWHLLFPHHEIVRANGAWAESLLTGPQALKGLGVAGRAEVVTLFPELASPDHSPTPARHILTGREGRKLAERLGRKGRQLIEAI
ncbi:MAG: Hint domain-containing protein [Paracoccus sp. (in: a-proteobacteria)]|uniref:Hint domain-containing protein n=1 Tax=Paracoccus sp. TaxID=267 RepID=UPI0026DEB6E3|nr:Hint domain-containing protein [Paracoccus sp. (in: a-proteobacteria)]MDO5613450.1 Hint domain-containing protein [Paracoccus sp. (in: a-proteobacteria)]